jgi:hypothetical protein
MIGDVDVYADDSGLRFEYDSGLVETVNFPETDSEVDAFISEIRGALNGKAEEWMR